MRKLKQYFILLSSIIITSLILIMICIMVFSSREIGIGWGISLGLILGNVITLVLLSEQSKVILLSILFYIPSLFLILYGISNFCEMLFFNNSIFRNLMFIIGIITCHEMSIRLAKYFIRK